MVKFNHTHTMQSGDLDMNALTYVITAIAGTALVITAIALPIIALAAASIHAGML